VLKSAKIGSSVWPFIDIVYKKKVKLWGGGINKIKTIFLL